MKYSSPSAFRDAIDQNLRNRKYTKGSNISRLRKRIAFERFIVRLMVASDKKWILKGGTVLEFRYPFQARATQDIDLALNDKAVDDVEALRSLLVRSLARDLENDWFEFGVKFDRELSKDEEGIKGWRFMISVGLAGTDFVSPFPLDIVLRSDEIVGTGTVKLVNSLSFADLGQPEYYLDSIDRNQHFAEKIHAITRNYGTARTNSRVKDLVDCIIFIEDDLDPSLELKKTCEHVFESRGTHKIKDQIELPTNWKDSYETQAEELQLDTQTFREATRILAEFWRVTIDNL